MLEGDPVLRRKSREVTAIDDRLRTLLDDLAETMYQADGVGLAAPQVGVLKRVVVIDVGDGLIELINPVIVEQDGMQCRMEGCLSVQDFNGFVQRPQHVVVNAYDREGNYVRWEGEDLLAIAMSHEIDHLDGILFRDKTVEPTPEQLAEHKRLMAEQERLAKEEEKSGGRPMRGKRRIRAAQQGE